MQRYQPAAPRVLAGFAALAMTIVTLSLAVLAPSTTRLDQQDVSAAAPEDHAYSNAGPLVTSIDVVAYRRGRVAPIVQKHVSLSPVVAS